MHDDQTRPRPDGPHASEREFELPRAVREMRPGSQRPPAHPEAVDPPPPAVAQGPDRDGDR
jgi:hypothetical protein